jgi:glycosyl transferase family 1
VRKESFSNAAVDKVTTDVLFATAPIARGCLTCDQTACFRHRSIAKALPFGSPGRSALLLDSRTPEWTAYVEAHHATADRFLPSNVRMAFWKPPGDAWDDASADVRTYRARAASWAGAFWLRWWARSSGGRRQASITDRQRWLARAYARRLRPEHVRLVVDQALLPHLAQWNVLGGRQVEVLAGAMPLGTIEAQLDAAAGHWPHDATLRDFRMPAALVEAEARALRQACRIVTFHSAVAAYASRSHGADRIMRVPWALPVWPPMASRSKVAADHSPCVVFPASALARKGARELAQALLGLDCTLMVLGTPAADPHLWRGIDVVYAGWRSDWLARADLVVLPAYVEHAPRAALAALSRRVPVIATPACGLDGLPGVHTVQAGDIRALRTVMVQILHVPQSPAC